MVQRSKKYREAAEKIDRNNLYTANEAIALLKSMPEYKFDQTVEAVLRLNVDPRKADQLVRGSVNLPNGTGKTAKVLVFARGPKATEALEAGADIVGDDDLIAKVQGGFLDFDALMRDPKKPTALRKGLCLADRLHPNAAGYKEMGRYAADFFAKTR